MSAVPILNDRTLWARLPRVVNLIETTLANGQQILRINQMLMKSTPDPMAALRPDSRFG